MITRFNGRLAKDLPEVSKTLLFEYSNAVAVSRYLVDGHRAELEVLFAEPGSTNEASAVEPLTTSSITLASAHPGESQAKRISGESRDIAIIGVAGRYPGSSDLNAFWLNLREGRCSVREISPDRWEDPDLYDQDPSKANQGKLYCKWGGFLDGVDEFDASFFNISPAEAAAIDPQSRLFLQTAWHAFEDAGYARSQLARWRSKEEQENVGVYVGVTHNTYQVLGVLRNASQPTRVDHSGEWSLANRVSYYFNFCGPSLPVDTACSASLSAIHLACESLRSGACGVALAGGVNLHLDPSKIVSACALGMLSPTGQCRSFGAGADGYVPGEGVGAIVLKPLNQAEQDGDYIYGVIKASAINHGGRTNGFTMPNPAAQAAVIVQTLRNARLDPRSISYVEAHGTGTELGDPIEVDGLTKAFTELLQEREGKTPVSRKPWCALGSAKSNIGHLEAAAGIAGLTKILLQMRHRQLTPSLHAESVNPNIDFSRTPFILQTTLGEWALPTVDGPPLPRRAGLSSFGAGGSNAHLIVEEYDDRVSDADRSRALDQPVVIPLSARGEAELKQSAANLLTYLRLEVSERIGGLREIAYTLQVAREPMEERLALTVASEDELREHLERFVATGTAGVEMFRGTVPRVGSTIPAVSDSPKATTTSALSDLQAVASRWAAGEEISWQQLYPVRPPRRIPLPGYPFLNKRYWYGSFLEGRLKGAIEQREAVSAATNAPSALAISALTHWTKSAPHFEGSTEVTLEIIEGHIAVVRMQDRANRNMFTPAILHGLMASFAEIERNETIKVVVVTGCDNVFSMGGTRDELMTLSDQVQTFADLEFIFK
ncbi:MAG: polyketide synthase PksL, partial [Acidobacteriaceae bacterium]|nr:polyketide synthase PksL [Acidobacteriaceae bacterium]